MKNVFISLRTREKYAFEWKSERKKIKQPKWITLYSYQFGLRFKAPADDIKI